MAGSQDEMDKLADAIEKAVDGQPNFSKPQTLQTPAEISAHEPKYTKDAWMQYTVPQLGHAVDFFISRSYHRALKNQAKKDVVDAKNYARMIMAHVERREKELA